MRAARGCKKQVRESHFSLDEGQKAKVKSFGPNFHGFQPKLPPGEMYRTSPYYSLLHGVVDFKLYFLVLKLPEPIYISSDEEKEAEDDGDYDGDYDSDDGYYHDFIANVYGNNDVYFHDSIAYDDGYYNIYDDSSDDGYYTGDFEHGSDDGHGHNSDTASERGSDDGHDHSGDPASLEAFSVLDESYESAHDPDGDWDSADV